MAGTWQMPQGELKLTQQFQMLSGTLGGATITDARVRGDQVMFSAGGVKYTGTVSGNTMKGTRRAAAPGRLPRSRA